MQSCWSPRKYKSAALQVQMAADLYERVRYEAAKPAAATAVCPHFWHADIQRTILHFRL